GHGHTSRGSVISPFTALAAAVAAEQRYTDASVLPCRPLKFRFDVESETSPGASRPNDPPMQGPQQGASTSAPAFTNRSMRPFSSAFRYSLRDAGMTSTRVLGLNFFLPSTSAASARSSYRPFVQEPIKTWSICVPSTLPTGTPWSTLWGMATCGSRSDTSYVRFSANFASSSLASSNGFIFLRPFMYSHVTLSGGTMPAFAPISIAMLQQVIRPGISIFAMVFPANSIAW